MNQSHIVDKKQPNGSRVGGAQLKPRQGTIEPAEKDRFAHPALHTANDKPFTQWLINNGERVDD